MTPQMQAQKWLDENCLILDTETTGLGDDAEIVEITIIDTTGKALLNTLVKPQQPIPAEAMAIHGITNEMVRNAPTWGEVVDQELCRIPARTLVIYNANYDVRLICQSCKRAGFAAPIVFERISALSECAMLAYAEFFGQKSDRGGYKWQRLTAAAEQQGVTIEGAPHRALSDCLTTLGVVKAMAAGGRRYAPQLLNAQAVVDILHRLFIADPDAITALVGHRVECSEKFAKETSATVGIYDSAYIVGLVGIINALIAPEVIAAIYDGEGLTGFAVTDITDVGGAA